MLSLRMTIVTLCLKRCHYFNRE